MEIQLWTFLLVLDLLRDLLVCTSVMVLESTSTDLSASMNVGTADAIAHRMFTPCTRWRVPKSVDVLLPEIKSLELASTIPLGRDRRLGNHKLPKSLVDLGVMDVLRCNVHGLHYVGI